MFMNRTAGTEGPSLNRFNADSILSLLTANLSATSAMACFHLLQCRSDVSLWYESDAVIYDTNMPFLFLGYILACDSYFDNYI